MCQKPNAIGAYRVEVLCPGLLALGQPLVLHTPPVTLEPLRIGVEIRLSTLRSALKGPCECRQISSLPLPLLPHRC